MMQISTDFAKEYFLSEDARKNWNTLGHATQMIAYHKAKSEMLFYNPVWSKQRRYHAVIKAARDLFLFG